MLILTTGLHQEPYNPSHTSKLQIFPLNRVLVTTLTLYSLPTTSTILTCLKTFLLPPNHGSLKSYLNWTWINIWNSQNSTKAKLLLNRSFNYEKYITIIRSTNMNPGMPQYYNCWKWEHSMFACRAHSSKY